MRLEQLYYVCEVYKTNSITCTAKIINVSQQNISIAIHRLEDELGFQIFNRSSKGVTPTDKGKRFIKKAEDIVRKVEDLKTEFGTVEKCRPTASIKGVISIYAASYFSNCIIPYVITDFIRQYPNIHVNVTEMDINKIPFEIINNESIDFGLGLIFSTRKYEKIDQIEYIPLLSDKMFVCVGQCCPLASKKSLSMSTLLKYPFIVFESSKNTLVHVLESYGKVGKNQIITTHNPYVYRNMIIDGHAISIIGSSALNKEIFFKKNEIVGIPIRGNTICKGVLMRPSNRTLSPAAEKFINALEGYMISQKRYHHHAHPRSDDSLGVIVD